MVPLVYIERNNSDKPHCRRIKASNVNLVKKKGYEKDPEDGFIFPVRHIKENYGEEHRPISSDSSSSSSSDEESSSPSSPKGAAETVQDEIQNESSHEPLDEDKTADDWVVQDDKVVRVHATPRHFLFDPRSCPFPVPLDYVDVLRYTDSNVKGHHNHVDCWWTDPEGDQGTSECIPGPWIGKTTFHLRLPAPKPGWSIQKRQAHAN